VALPPPKYISLVNIKFEDVGLILRGLDALAGEVDDMPTLSNIDALIKRIKTIIQDSSVPFRS
jgi:hypothetical protein